MAVEESYFSELLSDVVKPPRPLDVVLAPPRPLDVVLAPPSPLDVVLAPPSPLVLVPNELKRSPNDDIRSPLKLPRSMPPPRPDDVAGGLKRDELVVGEVGVALVAEATAEGEEYELDEVGVAVELAL